MTTQELKNIEERCEKATPGPWEDEVHHWGDTVVEADISDCRVRISSLEIGSRLEDMAEFILSSRTDIPALLAHIKAQDEEIEKLKNALNIRGAQESV